MYEARTHRPVHSDPVPAGVYDLSVSVHRMPVQSNIFTTIRLDVTADQVIEGVEAILVRMFDMNPVKITTIQVVPAPDTDTVSLSQTEYTQLCLWARGYVDIHSGTGWSRMSAYLDAVTERHPL